MTKKHNNLGRIVHRASEEMYATQKIAEVTSWPEAINTFRAKLDIQVMNHNGYKESDAVKKRLLRKHETRFLSILRTSSVIFTLHTTTGRLFRRLIRR